MSKIQQIEQIMKIVREVNKEKDDEWFQKVFDKLSDSSDVKVDLILQVIQKI